MTYTDRRIWIIGASAGIGAALARALHAQGARLVLSARDDTALGDLANECSGAQVVRVDLSDRGSLADAVRHVGAVDAVICTAALYDPGRVDELDPARAEELVRVNLLGTLAVAQLCPPIITNGGQLVLFGSVAGYLGLPKGQIYSATKAAIINLAESLRIELSPRVDVRLVCPGFVRSRLTDKNAFKMPAIIDADTAARHVLRGMSGRSFEIHFPKRFTVALKIIRMLPYAVSLRLTRRLG